MVLAWVLLGNPKRSDSVRLIISGCFGLRLRLHDARVVLVDCLFQGAVVQGREAIVPFDQLVFQSFPRAVRRLWNAFEIMLYQISPNAWCLPESSRLILSNWGGVG